MSTFELRSRRRRWLAIAGLGIALAAAASVGGLTITSGNAAAPPPPTTATATATATPSATPSPSASPAPETPTPETLTPFPDKTPDSPPAFRTLPAGPIAADPVRVHTGDGDCLNVRQAPGTTFAAEPNTCLPEGSLLWLYGPAEQVDGESWRYALGAGWVATRYTRATAAPKFDAGLHKGVTLRSISKSDVTVTRLDATGKTAGSSSFTWRASEGLGGRLPEISPDGQYIAFTSGGWGEDMTAVVGRIADGTTQEVKGAYAQGWSSTGDLLLSIAGSCTERCTSSWAVFDPASGHTQLLTAEPGVWDGAAWAADGKAVYLASGSKVTRFGLDGSMRTVLETLPANTGFYGAVASPDGTRLLVGGGFGPLNVLDLANGQAAEFQRAPQRQVGGSCGGAVSSVAGWLDASHIYYHERSSAGNQDGITIGDLKTGSRRVLPYFNVRDVSSPAPGFLSFATYQVMGDLQFTVTFLLDTATGDAVPMFAGDGATWNR
jgi:hypothetical protein